MATTSIWSIKNNLKNSIEYIINPEKTTNEDFGKFFERQVGQDYNFGNEKKEFVSAIHCEADDPYIFMKETKNFYRKNDGVLAYHAYQSFKEGEVTPDIAHEIGIKLAQEMWPNYEVVIATHLNTNHIHNHFIINSVSFEDGRKYNNNRTNLAKLRHISDSICEEYHLSTLNELPEYRNTYKYKVLNDDYYIMVKEDIDMAINESITLPQFENRLKKMGYHYQYRYNKLMVYKEGQDKVRLEKIFGKQYSCESIKNRLLHSHYRNYKRMTGKEMYDCFVKDTKNNHKGIRQLYLYYCYLLGGFPKKYSKQYLSDEMRKEIKKLNRYSDEVRFLETNKIETMEDLDNYETSTLLELDKLKDTREKLWRKYHRCKTEEEQDEIYYKIESIQPRIKELNKTKRCVRDIRERSLKMECNLKDLDEKSKSRVRENVR